MNLRARIGILLLLLVIAGGLAFGFYPRAIPVEITPAAQGPLRVSIEDEGKTRVTERYVISSPVAGYARRIDLHVGDALQAGQVLAQVDPALSDALDPRSRAQMLAQRNAAQAALSAAMENQRAAEAQAKLAQQELQRTEELRKVNFISEQALDRARTEAQRSKAVQQAALYNVNMARFELEKTLATLASTGKLQGGKSGDSVMVRAPLAARVLKIVHESEGMIQAGQPLLDIGNPASLEIDIDVLSSAAVQIVPGAKVLIDRWGGVGTLEGRVRTVEPTAFTKISALGVEEQRVHIIVDLTSPHAQWQRLGDGYRVEAKFVLWEGDNILQIPASALFRHQQGWAVFVTHNGRAHLRPVQIGRRAELSVQIVAGLQRGEQVITHPDDKIRDNTRVKIRSGT